MIPLSIAVAAASFRQPLRQSIDTSARSGATGVLFDARNELPPADYGETARRQLLHELDERRLKVAALSFPLRRQLHDVEQLDRRLEAIRGVMQFAAQLKCRIVTVNAMRSPAEADSREADRIRDILNSLAQFGNHIGVTLALTPVGEAPDRLIALLSGVRQGPIGVDFDPAGSVRSNRNPVDDLRLYAELISQFQVHDAVRGQDGDGKETAVGRGEVDWPALLALSHEIGYRGWMTVRRTDGTDPVGDVTRAIEFVQRVMHGG
jgi:sugar phosphate isomerase/epimerase